MSRCEICGHDLCDDLFSFVTMEPVCSICKQLHIGGLPTSPGLIAGARRRLGLKDGEYLKIDRAAEARRLLGREGP